MSGNRRLTTATGAAPAGRVSGRCSRGRYRRIGTGELARCLQHETDHLDGVLFIDRLDPTRRKPAMRALLSAGLARLSPHA